MNGFRFDALTKRVASRMSRRAALASAGLAAVSLRHGSAQSATPVAADEVELLFLQNAGATTLTPGEGDIHELSMTGVTAQTLYFANRPNRIAGAIPTATFTDGFAAAFGGDPPNASLVGHGGIGADEEEAVVVELRNPRYDAELATLTYEVRILAGDELGDRVFEQEPLTMLDAPRTYEEAHLFIDDADLQADLQCDCPDCKYGLYYPPCAMCFWACAAAQG
jgi:hypothetical protein